MGTIGEQVIAGIAWIIISIGALFLGLYIGGIVGIIIMLVGSFFLVNSIKLLWMKIYFTHKAIQWMKEDPEGFEEAQKEFQKYMEEK